MLPAGIILTGGAAQLSGIAELGREVLQMPVRVAAPTGIGGLVDTLLTPGLLHGRRAAPVGRDEPCRAASRCATSRRRRWAASAGSATRSGASSRRRRASSRSGPAPAGALADLTAAVRRVRRRDGRRGRRPALALRAPRDGRPRRRRVGAGSDDDLLDALDRLLPREDRLYRHRHGSPGHGADHVLPLLAPPSLTVPVVDGRLALGTWQSICLLDPNADNAARTVRLSFLPG